MARRRRAWCVSLLLCVVVGRISAAPAPSVTDYLGRGDLLGARTALATWLSDAEAALPGPALGPKLLRLSADPAYRLALAQHELLRDVGPDNLTQVATAPDGTAFLQVFLADAEWLEEYLASGPTPSGRAVSVDALRAIWSSDRTCSAGLWRHLATAVALCFGDQLKGYLDEPHPKVTPVSRYRFYRESQEAGRLHRMFAGLKTWELRFVVHRAVDHETLRWFQDHINVPLEDYPGVCWGVEYRTYSPFGDTIQGPQYYMPWSQSDIWATNVQKHGGVCGSLSTFGTLNAVAHGVPASTAGEPGHCAHAIRFGPQRWVAAYTVSGEVGRSMHQSFWSGAWPYVALQEAVYCDDGAQLRACRLAWQARLYQPVDRSKCYGAYDLALAMQPCHYGVWRDLVDLALSDSRLVTADWQALGRRALQALGPHPLPLTDLLARFDAKKVWPGLSPAQRLAWFTEQHQAVATGQGPQNYDNNGLLGRQMEALGKSDVARLQLLANALTAYKSRTTFFGQTLDWAFDHLGQTPAGAERVLALVSGVLADPAGGLPEEQVKATLARCVSAAEAARSARAFQSVSEVGRRFSQPMGHAKSLDRPPGGELVSGNGLLVTSSTCGYDQPLSHRDVLREVGGQFHTDREKAPWVAVDLGAACDLSGVLLVNRLDGSGFREKHLRLSVSADGATWQAVWEGTEVQDQWSIPLAEKHVRARYLKVESLPENPEFFHLRNVLVYGTTPKGAQ